MSDPREAFSDAFDFNNPSWRIFRIMSEFVDGFTFLGNLANSVTIFGSARLAEGSPYYEMARTTAKRLAEEGFTVVTGGGPGIMQAGNQGASEANGSSIGLNIQLPMEQQQNPYVKQGWGFHYFFSRKVMLAFSAEAYIFFPGGFGTLDELFELTTLIQTGKISRHTPIILMGKEFWQPLLAWIETTLRDKLQTISPTDCNLWTLTDNMEETVTIVNKAVKNQKQENLVTKGREHRSASDKLRQATKQMRPGEQ